PVCVLEEIEAADFVRAVVRTVPSADAPVVNHLIDPLLAVDGRTNGADQFARRVLAVHARNRLVGEGRIVEIAAEIAIYPDPVHLAAASDFFFANDRNVVFRLARDSARAAADARIQIDGHAPEMAGEADGWVETLCGFGRLPSRALPEL